MNELEKTQYELIELLKCQLMDISIMSKIELGDDVIEKIKELQQKINKEKENKYKE